MIINIECNYMYVVSDTNTYHILIYWRWLQYEMFLI